MNLELEITLRCNTKCPACNRHCGIVDWGDTDMTLEQVDRFVRQARERPDPLGLISVMGGEPTLHPHLGAILSLLRHELLDRGHLRRLQIATNGVLPLPQEADGLEILVSDPKKKRHRCHLVAPIDSGQKYRQCRIPRTCGIELTRFGYYPCGAGGAIARLFRMDSFVRYALPTSLAEFGDLMELCKLCQLAAVPQWAVSDYGNRISPSYERALQVHRACARRLPDF